MAVADPYTSVERAELVSAARDRLAVLDHAGPVALFGAAAHPLTEDLTAQRIDVEDVTAVGGRAVALLVQRGRRPDGTWLERRLSAVFGDQPEPQLYDTWVGGLDSASRARR